MQFIKLGKKVRLAPQAVVGDWLAAEGQSVAKGQVLFTLETASELVEVQAGQAGVLLKVLTPCGTPVLIDEPFGIVGQAGEDVSSLLAELDQPTEVPAAPAKAKTKPVRTKKTKPATQVKEESMSTKETTAAQPAGEVVPILMPQAGQTMEEGTVLGWKVKEGDMIEVGQVIMEIETDKATMEVEAVDAGRLARIVAAEGTIVEVKEPVAYLADNDADVDAFIGSAGGAAAAAPVSSAPVAVAVSADLPDGAVIPILMPQAGQTMEEGTVISWKIAEGDVIEVGQVIMEIETDKATMEVEAPDAGRVAKIVAAEGDIVEVKVPVAYIAENDGDLEIYLAAHNTATATQAVLPTSSDSAPKSQTASAGPSYAAAKSAVAVSDTGRVKASPAARKLAGEKGIDLASVPAGSGPGGRIMTMDVESADYIPTEPVYHPLTKMRKAIANNLKYSKQNVPHFYAKTTIDAGAMFSTYRQVKAEYKCSLNDFVTLACAKALRKHPEFRSQYGDGQIVEMPSANIGIAVGTDNGLTVPVIIGADRMTLKSLAVRTREVVENARNGKLEGAGQGVFTITNLGMFGVEEFQAIINPPEAAILAVGAIREGVVVVDGAMKPTRLMTVTVSADHRVIDGVVAAQFLATLKGLIEAPEQLL